MFTARSIHGPDRLQGLQGLAVLGTLATLPSNLTFSFGRISRSYPAGVARFAGPAPRMAAAMRQGLPATAAQLCARSLARLAEAAERCGQRWARLRERRLTELALHRLDARTLRDIGLTNSEIGSAAAEAAGEIEATRARIWLQADGRVY